MSRGVQQCCQPSLTALGVDNQPNRERPMPQHNPTSLVSAPMLAVLAASLQGGGAAHPAWRAGPGPCPRQQRQAWHVSSSRRRQRQRQQLGHGGGGRQQRRCRRLGRWRRSGGAGHAGRPVGQQQSAAARWRWEGEPGCCQRLDSVKTLSDMQAAASYCCHCCGRLRQQHLVGSRPSGAPGSTCWLQLTPMKEAYMMPHMPSVVRV